MILHSSEPRYPKREGARGLPSVERRRIPATAVLCLALVTLPATWAHAPQRSKLASASAVRKSAAIPAKELAGTWYAKLNGRLFALLSLSYRGGRFSGKLTLPQYAPIGSDGYVRDFGSTVGTGSFAGAILKNGHLRFSIERNGKRDSFEFIRASRNCALLQRSTPKGMPGFRLHPWKLHRGSSALRFSSPGYPPRIVTLQQRLESMVRADQAVRTGKHIDMKAMEAVDARHRAEVMSIYKKYGWPKWSLVGHRAADNYWLLVQHQTPAIQRELLPAMRKAVNAKEASPVDYAYLYDRVMVGEGKPQHWGTQAACKDGKPVIDRVDDPVGLATRRKALHLAPEGEYRKMLIPGCRAMSPQTPK